MNETPGLLTLADRLDRLSRGRAALASQTRSRTRPVDRSAPLTSMAAATNQAGESTALFSGTGILACVPAAATNQAGESTALATDAPETMQFEALHQEPLVCQDLAGPKAPEVERPLQLAEGATGAPRVLIAEIDPLLREVLTCLVENSGYAVDCAKSAVEAVSAFQSHTYALVILDCDSSEMRGLETAAAMRLAQGATARTPIVAITEDGGQERRKQRKAAGIDNYIAKPILRENVSTVLSRYAPVATAEPLAHYMALDRNRLVELDEAAGDRVEVLSRWINLFLEGAPEQLDRMRAAQEDNDPGAVCQAAHKLRSSSGQIGALRVQEIAGVIAALSGSGSLAGVESLLPEAALALERAVRELHTLENELRENRRPAAARSTKAAPGSRAAARSNQILLAEDDRLIARFLVGSLEGAGFPVTHIVGGRVALDALKEHEFGAVILDPDVREVDGYRILSEIRMSTEHTIPVMVVSSRHQEQDILRAFELGADDYITIPFNPLEVVMRLRRLLRQGTHVA